MVNQKSKQTIALLGSVDTKLEEMLYAREQIELCGCNVLTIDMSTRFTKLGKSDYPPYEVLKKAGLSEAEFDLMDKPKKIDAMSRAVGILLPALYQSNQIEGVLSIGGGQNARMAAGALKQLPFGVPKVLASSLACGERTMEQYVGTKDMMVVHTVADMSGLNMVTKTVIQNVCHAIVGMVQREYGGREIKDERLKVAATMLGITSKGVEGVLHRLPDNRFEKTCFHANGVGGRCMEELMEQGNFDLVLDMTLHEITCEMFGGYCSGTVDRMQMAIQKKLPMIVVPGAADMIDYYRKSEADALPKELEKRKYMYHNSSVIHAKITKAEAELLAAEIGKRLNTSTAPVVLVLPLKGFSEETAPGQPLCEPETDHAFIQKIKETLEEHVLVIEVDDNINGALCQQIIAGELLRLSKGISKNNDSMKKE